MLFSRINTLLSLPMLVDHDHEPDPLRLIRLIVRKARRDGGPFRCGRRCRRRRHDLDALVRRVDPDRWLSSRFIADPGARADVIALYAFDHELARAPRWRSNALLGEIRLTWWREALDEIFDGRPVRRHPTAQALAEAVAPPRPAARAAGGDDRRPLSRARSPVADDARPRRLDAGPRDDRPAAPSWLGGAPSSIRPRRAGPGGSPAGGAPGRWRCARRRAPGRCAGRLPAAAEPRRPRREPSRAA